MWGGVETSGRIFYSVKNIFFFCRGGERSSCLLLKNIVREKRLHTDTHGTSLFLIKKGTVEVYPEVTEGNKKVLASLKENDWFEQTTMISFGKHRAIIISLEYCEVVIDPKKLFFLLETSPAVIGLLAIMKERFKDKEKLTSFLKSMKKEFSFYFLPDCNPIH